MARSLSVSLISGMSGSSLRLDTVTPGLGHRENSCHEFTWINTDRGSAKVSFLKKQAGRAGRRLFLSDAERNRLKAQPSLWAGWASPVPPSSGWRERGAHQTRWTIQIEDALLFPSRK